MRQPFVVLSGLWLGCSDGPAPPQAVPVSVSPSSTSAVTEVVPPTQGPGVPTELELAGLVAQLPSADSLEPSRQRLLWQILRDTPSPCGGCGDGSLGACVAAPTPECPIALGLGERVARLVRAEHPGVHEAAAYPDLWFAAGRPPGIPDDQIAVVVWIDPSSSFLPQVLSHRDALVAEDTVITAIPWAPRDEGAELVGLCSAADDTWACLAEVARVRGVAEGEGRTPFSRSDLAAVDVEPQAAALDAVHAAASERDSMAEALGVRSTPTWFVDGHRLRGAQSLGAIGRLVELQRLDHLPAPE